MLGRSANLRMNAMMTNPSRKRLWLALGPLCLPLLAGAGLPEPDNLIYGAVSIAGRPATNAAVVVEARRALTGALLDAYPMTSDPRGQECYALSLERNTEPPPDSLASTTGEAILIVLLDKGVAIEQHQLTLPAAGQSVRLDLGPSLDLDGNGVPDGWEALNPDGGLASDLDGDGHSKLAEYMAGTSPADANSAFKVSVLQSAEGVQVSFLARRAEGVGYEGRARYYTLEQQAALAVGAWEAVSNYDRLPGSDQWVFYAPAASNAPAFYRARLWLEGP